MIYYIDFESWRARGNSADEACQRAEAMMKKGHLPLIVACCDEADDDDGEYFGDKEILRKK